MISLIGFTGAGKSSLGRQLSSQFGLLCFDVDALIEEHAQMAITQVFATQGEPAFRKLETEMISKTLQLGVKGVLVTGGGAVLTPDNRRLLQSQSFVVHVYAPVDTVWKRLREDQSRPLLKGPDPYLALTTLFSQREHAYDFAHVKVDSENLYESASIVMAKWLRFCY